MTTPLNRVLINIGNIPMRDLQLVNGSKGYCRDGSFIPYIVEELISRSAYQVVFDYGPDGFKDSVPQALKERVGWINSIPYNQKSLDYLAPAFDELKIATNGSTYWIDKENSLPEDNDNLHWLANINGNLEKLFLAIDERLQLDINLISMQSSLLQIRNILRGSEARARIAVLQGIIRSYEVINSPAMVAIPSASEVVVEHFQRLVCDSQYIELSENALQLGYAGKSKRSIEVMRRKVTDLLSNRLFSKSFNQGAKTISLATQVHVPETEVAESFLSRGYLPPVISLIEPLSYATKLWELHSPEFVPPTESFLERMK